MSDLLKSAVRGAVLRLLEPLVKWLLSAGVGVGDFVALVKIAYVRAAREQTKESRGGRPNVSRIAVLTGLTRIEIASLLTSGTSDRPHDLGRRQRAERVLSGWWSDDFFIDSRTGDPALLPVSGSKRSFTALVERYSGERASAGSILSELLRVKAVRRMSDGKLKALSRTYATVRWDPEGVMAFGEHMASVCNTLLHNLNSPADARYVRQIIKTRIDPRYIPLLRRDLHDELQVLVDGVDDNLNSHTYGAKEKGAGAALGLAVYVLEPGPEQDESEDSEEPARSPQPGRARRTG